MEAINSIIESTITKLTDSYDNDYYPFTWLEARKNSLLERVAELENESKEEKFELSIEDYFALVEVFIFDFELIETHEGCLIEISDSIEIEEQIYLESNLTESYCYCEYNDQYIWAENSVVVYDVNRKIYIHENDIRRTGNFYIECVDQWWTERYFETKNYALCYEDSQYYPIDDLYYWDSDGEYHNCEENPITNHIHSYSYRIPVSKKRVENENDELFFGIELEVEQDRSNAELREVAKVLIEDMEIGQNNIITCKTDGSLCDGFEIVTQPMTYGYIQEKKPYFADALHYLKSIGYRSYNSTTCGMHIHISKDQFKTWQLYRFLHFFQINKEFIKFISQRDADKLQRWANIENDENEKLIYKAKNKYGNSSRYVAVNLQNSHTVEIRIFRGTLNLSSFFKNIEFCKCLFEFSRDENDMTVENFITYVNNSNFQNLKKFVSNFKK